jgi:general secretion pathway protein M
VKMQSRSAAALSIGILLAAVAIMMMAAVTPYMQLGQVEETLEQNQRELLGLRNQISQEGELRKENLSLAAVDESASRLLLEGETTGIAGANLQKLLSGLVAEHGGAASSIQILPPKDDGNLVRISMSLSISVNIDGLRDILHALETGAPLLFIDDVGVRSDMDSFGAADIHFMGPLDVTLQVSGYASGHKGS